MPKLDGFIFQKLLRVFCIFFYNLNIPGIHTFVYKWNNISPGHDITPVDLDQ